MDASDPQTDLARSGADAALLPAKGACDGELPLAIVADSLVGVESSRALLLRLEELLTALHALPARLYLFDGDAQVFYGAAGFGCAREADDIDLAAELAWPHPRRHRMCSHGDWIGLLEILGDQPYLVAQVEQLGVLLAPTVISIHRHESLVQQLREVREEVTQLLGAGQLLHHLDVEVLLVKILETVMSAVRAEVGAVLTVDDRDHLQPRVALGLQHEHVKAIRRREDGRSVAECVQAEKQAMCLDTGQIEQQLDLSALGANLTGLLALPLSTRDRIQGVVLLANPAVDFGPAEQRLAETVCSLAAIALDNALLVKSTVDRERMRRELDLAQSIQRQMYPPKGLRAPGWVVDGMSRPCDETGGDYYSFLRRDDHLLAMIGDVSGHGLGAALFTTMAHAVIQQQLRTRAHIEPAFEALNEALFHTQSGRFMTAALVDIDPQGVFTYVSAGHNPLLWIHHGEPHWLASCGMPLGIVPMGAFPPPPSGTLAPGDLLILYTDGFTEAVNRAQEIYGEERLAAIARRGWEARLGPNELMLLISSDVDEWASGHPHEDDLTMVVIEVPRT
jgi:sigma-B regulation protein RsbU (phosphoserine phosphatase)